MKKVHNGETVSGKVCLEWSGRIIDTALLADGVREFIFNGKSYYLNVCNAPLPDKEMLEQWRTDWAEMIGTPSEYDFEHKSVMIKEFSGSGFKGELYLQNNAPGKVQKSILLLPDKGNAPYPVIIMPFYFPAMVIGFDPESGENFSVPGKSDDSWDRAARLARSGFAVLSCESYYITYIDSDLPLNFSRWAAAAEELKKDHPSWSGVGKLVHDNRLLIDMAESDPRLDRDRIAVMGHSLGGKIAFYTACLDPRLKAAVISDWGIGWHQTNWDDIWYWGDKLKTMEEKNMEHSQLMALCNTPMLVIAGFYDDEGTKAFFDRAAAVCGGSRELQLDDHGSGHCIPAKSFDNAVNFIRKHLKINQQTGEFQK